MSLLSSTEETGPAPAAGLPLGYRQLPLVWAPRSHLHFGASPGPGRVDSGGSPCDSLLC